MSGNTWWIIERGQQEDGTQFWVGPGWGVSALEAVRFPNKDSAQDFLDHYSKGRSAFGTPWNMRGFAFPVEHLWADFPSKGGTPDA